MPTADINSAASGMAALSICESLLLALIDCKVLAPLEASALLADVAAAHGKTPQVVALIDRINSSVLAAESLSDLGR